MTYVIKSATGRAEFGAHIDTIKSYESRLEDLVEKDERMKVESEIEIAVFDMTEDDPV